MTTVTDEDRKAAAEVLGAYESMTNRQRTLDGSLDMHPVVEAFARHREAATEVERERCAKVAGDHAAKWVPWTDYKVGVKASAEYIARKIRNEQ